MKTSNVHFSFIILTYNSEKYITKCLSSINNAVSSLNKKSEVYIIDNGSIDSTNKIVSSKIFCDNITLYHLQLGSNTGTTFSRNIGLRSCSGEYIVIQDSDAYINSEALIKLESYLSGNPKTGIAVPKITFSSGRYQLSTDIFPTIYRKFYRYFFLRSIEKCEPPIQTIDVDYAISAFWMFRRELINKVGLLDEKIFYSPEDVDYCIRTWKINLSVTYIPTASIVHDAQEISRSKGISSLFNKFTFLHIKGLLYLYVKHRFLFSTRGIRK